MAEHPTETEAEMSALLAAMKAAREGRGWVLKDVAERLDLSLAAIGHYETGARRADLETFKRWAAIVGVGPRVVDDYRRLRTEEEIRDIANRGRLSPADVEMLTQLIRLRWGR